MLKEKASNIGFNRGRIITYKLRQQVDVDELYEKEFFKFERSMGQKVCIVACKIRGVRNLANRPATTSRAAAAATPSGPPLIDDGPRLVRIIGCKYHAGIITHNIKGMSQCRIQQC